MSKPYFMCVVCNKQLEASISCDDDTDTPVGGGLHFNTYGNYGSTVFDPVCASDAVDPVSLEIVICDQCVVDLSAKGQIRTYRSDGTAAVGLPKEANESVV